MSISERRLKPWPAQHAFHPAPTYILCSLHPRTGMTTTTRLLADFHAVERKPIQIFTTDPRDTTLETWFADACTIADVTTTPGQMVLFEQLMKPSSDTRIVEISARSFQAFFARAREIGMFDEAKRRELKPVILFVSNGSATSVEAARTLRGIWPAVPLVTVLNEGLFSLGPTVHDHLAAFPTEYSFQIPPLPGALRSLINAPALSLSRFFSSEPPTNMSILAQADLREWLKRNFAQFRAHEVRTTLEEANYLLR